MALSRLLPQDSRTVVQAALQTTSLPESLLQTIITRAAGNPFFLEELTWAVKEQRPHPGTLGLPDTIQSVLAARIDHLPPVEKHLLQTAAVIGTEVAVPLLRAIAEIPADAVSQGLVHLQAAEFVYETHRFPEHVYTFKHALTHEVAYGGLLQERRRALHVRIVEAFEALAGEGAPLNWRPSADAVAGKGLHPAPTQSRQRVAEQVERLAHHALHGEVWDKALTYCRQAGEKAIARSAYREALGYFEQALVASRRLPAQRAFLTQGIEIHLIAELGAFAEGRACGEEAVWIAEAAGHRSRAIFAQLNLGMLAIRRGDLLQAIGLLERALAGCRAADLIFFWHGVALRLGLAYALCGRSAETLPLFEQVVIIRWHTRGGAAAEGRGLPPGWRLGAGQRLRRAGTDALPDPQGTGP
jgi:predicted ATPase